MEIIEARQKVRELENSIALAIREFERESGCTVRNIELGRITQVNRLFQLTDVKIHTTLT